MITKFISTFLIGVVLSFSPPTVTTITQDVNPFNGCSIGHKTPDLCIIDCNGYGAWCYKRDGGGFSCDIYVGDRFGNNGQTLETDAPVCG